MRQPHVCRLSRHTPDSGVICHVIRCLCWQWEKTILPFGFNAKAIGRGSDPEAIRVNCWTHMYDNVMYKSIVTLIVNSFAIMGHSMCHYPRTKANYRRWTFWVVTYIALRRRRVWFCASCMARPSLNGTREISFRASSGYFSITK